MQTRRRRHNPTGSRGLRPKTLSFVVSGHPGQLPPPSSSSARKPRLRGLREFFSTLLTGPDGSAPAQSIDRPTAGRMIRSWSISSANCSG